MNKMNINAEVFSSHLNYYSKHSRSPGYHLPDSLYFEIGQPLPSFELEFRSPRNLPTIERSSEMDFDRYQGLVKSDRGNISPDPYPPTIQQPYPHPPENEQLNRSHDQIRPEQITEERQEVMAPPMDEEPVTTSHIVEEALLSEMNAIEEVKEDAHTQEVMELEQEEIQLEVAAEEHRNEDIEEGKEEPPHLEEPAEVRKNSQTMPSVPITFQDIGYTPKEEAKPQEQAKRVEVDGPIKKVPFRLAKKQIKQTKNESTDHETAKPADNRQQQNQQPRQNQQPLIAKQIEGETRQIKKNFKKRVLEEKSPIRRLTEGGQPSDKPDTPPTKQTVQSKTFLMKFFESNS